MTMLKKVVTKVLEAIDGILARSPNPPIIILQSDHGPQIPRLTTEPFAHARLANLAAFHLPGAAAEELMGPEITPVNQFRRLFNHYFGADYEILSNRHFRSHYHYPLRFHELQLDELDPGPLGNSLAPSTYSVSLGSTGHWPVPSGDSPGGTGWTCRSFDAHFRPATSIPFRSAGRQAGRAGRPCYPTLNEHPASKPPVAIGNRGGVAGVMPGISPRRLSRR